jgi:hypothetical protein
VDSRKERQRQGEGRGPGGKGHICNHPSPPKAIREEQGYRTFLSSFLQAELVAAGGAHAVQLEANRRTVSPRMMTR